MVGEVLAGRYRIDPAGEGVGRGPGGPRDPRIAEVYDFAKTEEGVDYCVAFVVSRRS